MRIADLTPSFSSSTFSQVMAQTKNGPLSNGISVVMADLPGK
jgi:hypothetical protein